MSSVVKSLAPVAGKALGTALGGPVGGLVGGQLAGSLFGADRAREAAGVESGAIREGGEVAAQGILEGGAFTARGLEDISESFRPLTVGAESAAEMEAALSGALGPEAQAAAFENIQANPFTEFVRRSGEKSIGQGFAASGGLGGGARLKALTEFGQDISKSTIADQIANLRNVRSSGTSALTRLNELVRQGVITEGEAIARAEGIRGDSIAKSGQVRAGGIRDVGEIGQEGIEGIAQTFALRKRLNRAAA